MLIMFRLPEGGHGGEGLATSSPSTLVPRSEQLRHSAFTVFEKHQHSICDFQEARPKLGFVKKTRQNATKSKQQCNEALIASFGPI